MANLEAENHRLKSEINDLFKKMRVDRDNLVHLSESVKMLNEIRILLRQKLEDTVLQNEFLSENVADLNEKLKHANASTAMAESEVVRASKLVSILSEKKSNEGTTNLSEESRSLPERAERRQERKKIKKSENIHDSDVRSVKAFLFISCFVGGVVSCTLAYRVGSLTGKFLDASVICLSLVAASMPLSYLFLLRRKAVIVFFLVCFGWAVIGGFVESYYWTSYGLPLLSV